MRGPDLEKLMHQMRMLQETMKEQEKEIRKLKAVSSGNARKIQEIERN